MGKEKNVLSVEEAKEQFRESMARFQAKKLVVDNILPLSAASLVLGMISADSAKARESLISLAVTVIKKAL
ncbi:MAG: hypothetical protein GX958_01265 [Desulfitobacterium sp.]|nr:hypothetical protein [Desulfitobacterium sp.]